MLLGRVRHLLSKISGFKISDLGKCGMRNADFFSFQFRNQCELEADRRSLKLRASGTLSLTWHRCLTWIDGCDVGRRKVHPPPLDGVESAAERPSSELRTSSSVGIVDFVGDFIGGDFIGDAAYVNIDGTTFLPVDVNVNVNVNWLTIN